MKAAAPMLPLVFMQNPASWHPAGGFVARLQGAFAKTELLAALQTALHLPPYFGHNWDALYDCLIDLSWLHPSRITLLHERPLCLTSAEAATYMEVLRMAAVFQHKHHQRHFQAIFPAAMQ